MMMTMFNGRRVNPRCLTVEDIQIENIAHALSNLCRFGGHSREFYSVAQHSVRVARFVAPELMLEGLLHDSTEAFIQDLVRPIKHDLDGYNSLEKDVWQVIGFKYGFDPYPHELVQYADNAVLKSEFAQFVNGGDVELTDLFWDNFEAAPTVDRAWNPVESKAKFLITYAEAVAARAEYLQRNVHDYAVKVN